MFLLNIKRFVKSPVFLISTVAYFVILYVMQPTHIAKGIEDISNSTLTTQPFSFLFFMMISYEFFYQINISKLGELISVSGYGVIREKCYGLLIFLGLDLVMYVMFPVISAQGTASVMREWNTAWFVMLAKAYLIYHFLTYLFAILAGLLISFIHSRIRAFGVLIFVFSLFSQIILPVLMQCVNASEKWTHIMDIFGIMNRNYYIYCDLYYNYSVENVNIQRVLFWILLTLSILSAVVNRGKKHILTGMLFAASFVTFVFYIQPAGYRYVGGDWGAYMEEQQYYTLLYDNVKEGIARSYKDADFKVLKYEGELSAKRVLEASLDLTVDKEYLEQYCFTLYHGYQVREVSDQDGNGLSFEQQGDHVLVRNDASGPVTKLHFEYSGFSRKYVATSQAVFLGGNFPYVPHPGWNVYKSEPVEVHDDPMVTQSWDVSEYGLKGLGYKTDYDLWFHTAGTVYSNLDEKEPSHFAGTSEGATFVACDYIREMKIRNCTVYYSALCAPYFRFNLDETVKRYEDVIDEYSALGDWENMKIFDMMFFGDGTLIHYYASDHMISDDDNIPRFYPYYLETGKTPSYNDIYGDE